MSEVARRRLAAQGIADARFSRPVDVVKWLVAVQAQDYLGGLWAVGLRMRKAAESDVERALANRSIVRTWPMRGTLHFVAAADVRWMLELLTPRVLAGNQNRLRNDFSIDAKVLSASRRVLIKALRDGALTRDAVYQALDDAGIVTDDGRGLHIVFALAHEGLICFGARRGKQQTFVLLDEWLPPTPSMQRDEAMGTLARRYFTGHGPATMRDFAWWSGLTSKDAARAVEMAQPLEHESVDGCAYYSAGHHAPTRSSAIHLLPAWDEYTVGYQDRADLLHDAHRKHLDPRYGVLNPVMVQHGRVIGSWKRVIGRGQVVVKPRPFERLTKAQQQALRPAIRRYGVFLGLPAALAGP